MSDNLKIKKTNVGNLDSTFVTNRHMCLTQRNWIIQQNLLKTDRKNDYLKLSLEDWFDKSDTLYFTVVWYSGNPEPQKNC